MNYDKKLELVKNEVQRKIQDFEKSGRRLDSVRIAREICKDHIHEFKCTCVDTENLLRVATYVVTRSVVDEQLKRRQN